jgi:hypothetical protein
MGGKLSLRCVRSIAAHTLSTAAPLLVVWPDLIVSGLPNDTAHCQSPRSSRTTVYSTPRYSIDRPIGNANLPSRTPPQWSILLALRKLNGQRPVRPIADGSARYLQGLQDTSHAFSMRLYLWRAGSSVARSASWAQLLLESKQDMKRRGMPSPDSADACALCFSEPGGATIPRSLQISIGRFTIQRTESHDD